MFTEVFAIKKSTIKPLIKWAGGKKQLLGVFEHLIPHSFNLYIEPFVGGGALFFFLEPERAVIIDKNEELVNFYIVVRDHLDELVHEISNYKNEENFYYEIRSLKPEKLNPVQRAARFLYLNKTAYNGLWRVNKNGEFNVPYGRYKNPRFIDIENFTRAREVLRRATIICDDFEECRVFAGPGSFIYFDPPYHPLSYTAYFTSYTSDSFNMDDQIRLANLYKELDKKGCKVMLSNSDTPLIRELYNGYNITQVWAKRAINCRPDKRGPITELVIRNYAE